MFFLFGLFTDNFYAINYEEALTTGGAMSALRHCRGTCQGKMMAHDEEGRCKECGTFNEAPTPSGQPTESGEGDNVPRWNPSDGD